MWQIGLFQDRQATLETLQEKHSLCYKQLQFHDKYGQDRYLQVVANVYLEDKHQVIQCNIRDVTATSQQSPCDLSRG